MIRKAWMFSLLLVSLATVRLTAQQYGPPASGNSSVVLFAPATLNLVAGLNGAGYGGDGGPANSATTMLSYPVGIAYDANGNLFIADEANHVVRRIDHGTGDISTFAGQEANPGFSIGGGVPTNAQMQAPSGLVVDSNNNVYVADRFNNVVFEITHGGTISIFAGSGTAGYGGDGGLATAAAAEFNNPWGLGIDSNNNIYVADTANNLIRKVTQAGNLSTFAGDVADVSGCNANEYSTASTPYTASQAHLCFPQGIAFDSLGNAYISDTKNDIIRKVDTSGNLTQFAGTFKTSGFSGDGGPATSAWFNLPAGLYVDPAGRVYISDMFNERIRVVDTLGNINTVFGDGFGSLNAASIGEPDTEAVNVTSGPANGIYNFVLDQEGRIIATDSSSNAVTSAGSTGQYVFPEQFVFTPSAAKYVTVENPSGVTLDFLGAPALTGPYSLATGASAGTCNFSGTLQAGGTCTIGVIFTPIVDDTKNPGSLTLTTNANSSPSTINFSGMSDGTGITSASLTGPSQSFSAVVGQTSAAEQSTLKNTGQEPIAVTSVAFGGANPTDFAVSSTTCPASPATLASGASCAYSITFTPTNTSTATSSFQVNIANYGQLSSPINGVGTAAATPAATPVISPASGTYNAAVAVQITDSTANSTIYYTTTGTVPVVPASPTYSGVFTVANAVTEVQALATASGDSTSSPAAPTTYNVQPYLIFNPAMVGIAAGSAQQLTAQFSLQGIVAPTASLHYGQDYSMGTFSCTPNGTIEVCSVAITFTPTLPGTRKDALFLMNGSTRVATVLLDGTGQAPLALIQPGVVTQVINSHGNGLFDSIVDENGTVYALSTSTNAILVMTKAGVVSNLPVTGLSSPRTISIDGAGVLYIHGATDDASMMTYDTVQGIQGSLALPATHFWQDTSIGNTGNLYAVAGETGVFYTIKPDGTSTNVALSPAVPGAASMAVDSAEDVFIGGQSTSEITPSGTQTGFSGLDAQNAVIVDAANSVYAAPYSGFNGIVELPASNYNGAPIADIDADVLLVLGASMRSDGTLFVGSVTGLDQVDRSQGAISFGSQMTGTTSTAQTVSLYNGGNENLTLTNFVLTGAASGFALQTATSKPCIAGMSIAPGALCNVAVTLTPPNAGSFSGSIKFTTNTLNTPSTNQTVGLSGFVNGINVTVSPNPLNFGNQTEGTSSAAQTVTLTNNGVSASAGISTPLPVASGYVLGIGTCNSAIPPAGGTCQLSVTFEPALAQAYDEVVSLSAISEGVGANQTVSFNVNGTGTALTPTLTVTPSSATITTAQALTVTVTVGGTPTPTGSVTLTSGSYSSGAVTLSGGSATINIPAGLLATGSDTLTATYTPDSASSAVYTSATGTSLETVTQAAAGPITASPANWNFGTVPVGSTSSVVSVTLTFPTAVTLSKLSSLTQGVANLDFAIQASGTTCVAGAQGAGSMCTVALTFSPLYPGPRYGALVLYDSSSPANAVATVYLTGIGQSPLFAIVPGVMTTVAGNGTAASSGDNGQATSASLVPVNMALDGAGDIFVQDSSSSSALIRRIDATSGVISTIAGGGGGCGNQSDSLGDGCEATLAKFSIDNSPGQGPPSVYDNRFVLDGAGNVYTTDLLTSASAPSGYSWIIRKIDAATGIVSNVTPASSSIPLCTGGGGLNPTVSNGTCFLEIAAVDGSGIVYLVQIESNGQSNLLALSPQPAALTTVANSFLNSCIGTIVCTGGGSIDGQGNLWLADHDGNVEKIALSTGTLTAWNGPSLGCDSTYVDPVLRMDAAGDGYFAPGSQGSLNETVVCEASATAQAAVYYAGTDNAPWPFNGDNIQATQANIALVGDIELDGKGNLYISDSGNNRIRKDTVGTGTPIVFPSTAEGATSAPINVTIQNIGNAALSFSSIVASPQFTFNNSGTTCAAQGQIAPGTTCVLAIAFAPTTSGAVTGTITFGDNSLNSTSTAQISLSGTATGSALSATTTTVQASAASVTIGTSVTLTATVAETGASGVPTGTVTFLDGTTSIGTGTLNSSGVATLMTSSLAVGTHSITAQYGGDSNNAASTSGAVSVTVTAPVASLTPAIVPFGSVTSGTTSAASVLTLSNSGTAVLNISGITIGGANPSDFAVSTGANACGTTLAAGANCSIYVTFTPATAASFNATLQIADDAAGSPQTATLSGTGTAAATPIASLTPATVPFGSLTAGTTSGPMSLTLSNSGNATLNITGITIGGTNPADFAVSTGANACGTTLAAGSSCSIYVTFTPATAATFSAMVLVADNATGSPQSASLTGTGTAAPAPVVTLAPTSVAFAGQTSGTTSAPTTVTLTNSGNAALTIVGITIAGTNPTDFATTTGSNACGSSLAAGATCNIYVTFTPATAASFAATLSVADNASGSPQGVALTGSGVAPADFTVTATPSSQTVQSGGSTTYTVTVSSSGGTFSSPAALTVSGLPTGATGSFSPASVTPGSTSANSTLTVQTATTATTAAKAAPGTAWPLAVPALAAVGMFFVPGRRRRRWISLGILLLGSLGAMTALSGCNGGFRFTQPSQTYTLTITGTSGTDTHSTTVQLTVE